MKRLVAFLFLAIASAAFGQELQKFENCSLVEAGWADGDSFPVKLPDGKEIVLRLYYVDCNEVAAATETDQRRVTVGGTNYNGIGQFKFAHVHNDNTFVWRNDGATTSGEHATAFGALVQQGLYATLLDDRTLSNMPAIPSEVFANSKIGLRVRFTAGGAQVGVGRSGRGRYIFG